MTTALPTRLLISHITLRGPELRQVYEAAAVLGEAPYEVLARALMPADPPGAAPHAIDDAPLREALSFLVGAGLLARRGAGRRASFHATPLLPGAPLDILLLHHIRRHPDERQRAVALVQEELARADTLGVSPAALRERMERGPHGALFAWTGEKIQLWWHLAAFLGLARRSHREPDILAIPQPALVERALRWAGVRTNSTSADALLREVDAQLFACTTARGRPTRAIAQALLALERGGRARLAHHADSAGSLLIGERRVSDILLMEGGAE